MRPLEREAGYGSREALRNRLTSRVPKRICFGVWDMAFAPRPATRGSNRDDKSSVVESVTRGPLSKSLSTMSFRTTSTMSPERAERLREIQRR